MNLDTIKAIPIRDVIEAETGIQFKRRTLQYCPFCNSGNHGYRDSDSAFSIKETNISDYFQCFSCGRSGSVLDFIMAFHEIGMREAAKYIEEKYLQMKTAISDITLSVRNKPKAIKLPNPEYIPIKFMNRSLKSKNNLTTWLKNQYGKEEAVQAARLYKVGTSKKWKGATVFFNIDEEGLVRRGKIMLYDSTTGKRNRNLNPTSVHSVMKLKEKPDSCLFGLHLRDSFPDKIIAVVESEKTAIIMSIICPDYLWMATGGLSFLSPKHFKPLKSREVLLFPDLGEAKALGTPFEQWERKLPEIRKQVKKAEISDLLERKCSPKQRKDGFDIADYFTGANR